MVAWVVLLLSPVVSASDRPTQAGDFARTGVTGSVPGPGTGAVLWEFQPPTFDIAATPAIVDGVVYVGPADGVVYALDARNGSLQWTFSTAVDIDFGVSAIVANGTLFVAMRDGNMYALDAKSMVWAQRWIIATT